MGTKSSCITLHGLHETKVRPQVTHCLATLGPGLPIQDRGECWTEPCRE